MKHYGTMAVTQSQSHRVTCYKTHFICSRTTQITESKCLMEIDGKVNNLMESNIRFVIETRIGEYWLIYYEL